jgi:DNA-binding CsgD family transcriptional regulator
MAAIMLCSGAADNPRSLGFAAGGGQLHTVGVGRKLTAERVRRDVEALARGGMDLVTYCAEFDESLRRAVPSCASCVATFDPATNLLTGGFKYGEIEGRDEFDEQWGLIEYGQVEETSFTELAHADVPAAGVHVATGGDVERSARMRDLILPQVGCADELRLIARVGGRVWGGMAWFGEQPFSAEDVALVASVSEAFATGLRAGILARLVLAPPAARIGPAVVIVDADDEISQVSPGAQTRLEQLGLRGHGVTPSAMIGALVGSARRYGAGLTDVLPRNRVQLPSGQWLVLHASPLSDSGGATGNVVVTIEEARPPEIVPLVVAAFDLTDRERDVIELVLRGIDTKEIATALHLSAYTVQDHLKSVFEKSGVSSRRELIGRVFLGQYAPRLGAELAPSGWFLEG